MNDDPEKLAARVAELEDQVAKLRQALVGDLVYQAAANAPTVGSYLWNHENDEVVER